MKKCYNNQRGYIILLTILLVGAVGLSIAISVILIGIGQTRTSVAVDEFNSAKAYANSCIEEGLQQIRDLDSFTGSGSLTFTDGSCNYSVSDLGGDNREIQATGTVGNATRKIKVTISAISPLINISSWQEVESF